MIRNMIACRSHKETMTPAEWSTGTEIRSSCSCRMIPVINLEDETPTAFCVDKSTSTRCACSGRTSRIPLTSDVKASVTRKPLATVDDASASLPINAMKNQYFRSINDAIKWYTEKNPRLVPVDLETECDRNESTLSRENLKPQIDVLIPKPQKPVSYFPAHLIIGSGSDRDYCYVRNPFESVCSPKLATRRGQRHYLNREPCPSCFHGRDFLCVYEFIRQAKVIGVDVLREKAKLQSFLISYLMKYSKKS